MTQEQLAASGKQNLSQRHDEAAGQLEHVAARKRSSQALMATSLGEDSFIAPCSPIHQKNARRLFDSTQQLKTGEAVEVNTPEDPTGSEITFIKQAKGTQSGEEESSPQGKKLLKLKDHNTRSTHDVVDVMHAGVDT